MPKSHILDNITSGMPYAAREIVSRLVERRDELGLGTVPQSFSISELRLSETDVSLLLSICQKANTKEIARLLEATTGSYEIAGEDWAVYEAIALVLFVTFTEYARRHSNIEPDSKFWETISKTLPESAELFPKGYPSEYLRDCIEQVVRRPGLGLRHRFDFEDTHQYYSTIMVQFGFSESEIGLLAHKLDKGNTRESHLYLLNHSTGKASYSEFWQLCIDLRKGRISTDEAEMRFASNPFVLKPWIPRLIQEAQRYLLQFRSSEEADLLEEADNTGIYLTHPPQIIWSGIDHIKYRISLAHDALAKYGQDDATIYINNVPKLRLLRKDRDNTFDIPLPIILEEKELTQVVRLRFDYGSGALEQDIQLWTPEIAFTTFDACTGNQKSSEAKNRPTGDLIFVTAEEMSVMPQVLWKSCAGAKFSYVSQHVNHFTIVDESGEVVWVPFENARAHIANDVIAYAEPTSKGASNGITQEFDLVIVLPADTELKAVHLARRTCKMIQCSPNIWRSAPDSMLRLGIDFSRDSIPVQMNLIRAGQAERSTVHVALKVFASFLRKQNGWSPINRDVDMRVDHLARHALRVLIPTRSSERHSNSSLFEGTRYITTVKESDVICRDLLGIGSAIEYRDDRFNPQHVWRVTGPTVWRGLIDRIYLNPGDFSNLSLTIPNDLEGYDVLTWTHRGDIRLTPSKRILMQSEADEASEPNARVNFDVLFPDGHESPRIVALAFQGECSGRWQASNQDSEILDMFRSIDTQEALMLMRWLRVPFLIQPYREIVIEKLISSPDYILVSGIQKFTVDNQILTLSSKADDIWFTTMLELFLGETEFARHIYSKMLKAAFPLAKIKLFASLNPPEFCRVLRQSTRCLEWRSELLEYTIGRSVTGQQAFSLLQFQRDTILRNFPTQIAEQWFIRTTEQWLSGSSVTIAQQGIKQLLIEESFRDWIFAESLAQMY